MTQQRKLLTIDGGGIRGVLALEILAEMERHFAKEQNIPLEHFRLSDFFDYVGGTSTGAVVAACIALGMSSRKSWAFTGTSGRICSTTAGP